MSGGYGKLGISNFGMNVSNEKLLNAAKWQELLPFLRIPSGEVKIPSFTQIELKFQ